MNKWRGIANRTNDQKLLESGFSVYAIGHVRAMVADGLLEEAKHWLNGLILSCQGHTELPALKQLQQILAQTTAPVKSGTVDPVSAAQTTSSFQNLFNMVAPLSLSTPEELCKDNIDPANAGKSNKKGSSVGRNN